MQNNKNETVMQANPEPYIETRFGTKFYFLNPNPEDIDIKDIAFSLANQCRFNGHVPFFSVAEHSIAVAARLPPAMQLAGLMHDAAEAYLSDIPSPIKQYLPDYQAMEIKVQDAINQKFGIEVSETVLREVKLADKDQTATEAHYLLESQGASWVPRMFVPDERYAPRCLPPVEAVKAFLHWFKHLTKQEETLAERMGIVV